MSGLKESRKKIQRSIEFLAQHAEVNRSAALHELLQVSKTLMRCLNEVNDPGKAFRFFLLDKDEDDAKTSNASSVEEDTTYGEQFRQAFAEACSPTVDIRDCSHPDFFTSTQRAIANAPFMYSEEQVNNYFAQEAAELAEDERL